MNIKHYINKFVAILALATLVSGFQFNNAQGAMVNLESAVGIEEAYAGPCGRRGCDGSAAYCDSYTVFEVGGIVVERHCDGVKIPEIE
ncbi:MAG: hypothetical protein JXR20_10755 [Balneola sp.]